MNRFFGCGEGWYHFQHELMVSEMVVQVIISFAIIINAMHLACVNVT